MKTVEGLSYREWQQRNKKDFDSLTKNQKKEARKQGFHNIGWDKVLNSWKILCNFNNVVTLFEHKLKKGDIIGAIEQSIAESNQSDTLAKEAISVINNKQQFIDKLVETTLLKYPIL